MQYVLANAFFQRCNNSSRQRAVVSVKFL